MKPPTACNNFVQENDEVYVENKNTERKEKSSKSLIIGLAVTLIIILILFIVFYIKCTNLYKAELPEDISFRINSAVSNYFAFQDREISEKSKMVEVFS